MSLYFQVGHLLQCDHKKFRIKFPDRSLAKTNFLTIQLTFKLIVNYIIPLQEFNLNFLDNYSKNFEIPRVELTKITKFPNKFQNSLTMKFFTDFSLYNLKYDLWTRVSEFTTNILSLGSCNVEFCSDSNSNTILYHSNSSAL